MTNWERLQQMPVVTVEQIIRFREAALLVAEKLDDLEAKNLRFAVQIKELLENE